MNKFFRKLLITTVSITFGYTFLLFGFSLYNSRIYTKESLNKKNEYFITQIQTNLDSKFIMAKNVINYMKYNEYIIEYNNKSEIDYYIASKIHTLFAKNQASFAELGYLISIFKENSDMVITPFGTRDLNSFIQENGIPLSFSSEIKESFSTEKQSPIIKGYLSQRPVTSDNPFTGRSITFREKLFDHEKKLMFFFVFYQESLLPSTIINDGEAIILYEGDRLLFNNSKLDNSIVESLVKDGIEPENYHVYSTKSTIIPNGGYIYITPQKSFDNFSSSDFYRNLTIYIVLILFSIMLSIYITKKNYIPIKNILHSLNWQGGDRDEFQYINDTTKRIQDANTELTNSIMHVKIPLKVKFLRDCLNGLLRKDEIDRNSMRFNLDIETDKITAVLIHFNNDEILMNSFSNETIINIRNKVSFIIEEHLKQCCRFELIDISYLSSTAIIFNMSQEEIRAVFKKILVELSNNEELDITVSLGSTVNSLINIKRSYFSAVSEMDKWSGISKHLLPVLDEKIKSSSVNFFYPLETERRIIKYISTGKEESLSLIISVLERNKDTLHLSKDEWKSFVRGITRTIKRVLTQINKTERLILDDGVTIQDYIVAENRNQEVINMMNLFRNILRSVQQTSKGEQKTFADNLIKYVNENYSDPNLSLIDIAEFFSLSPAYISRIFKDFTGRNFKDLLSLERVKKSKEILNKNPQKKVYELGLEVGFNSTNTFLRTFKKYTGISPGKYAKTVQEG